MKLDMQKKSILKILGGNDKNIKLRKIWGVVMVWPAISCDGTKHTKACRGQSILFAVSKPTQKYRRGIDKMYNG